MIQVTHYPDKFDELWQALETKLFLAIIDSRKPVTARWAYKYSRSLYGQWRAKKKRRVKYWKNVELKICKMSERHAKNARKRAFNKAYTMAYVSTTISYEV